MAVRVIKKQDRIEDEVHEIHEDVEELQHDIAEIQRGQASILHRLKSAINPEKFAFDDLAQQIVGAMVLSAPLAVTQEVWQLSADLTFERTLLILGITLVFDILLLYYTKYQLVEGETIGGIIPTRLFSLIIVSYLTAGALLYILGVIDFQVHGIAEIFKLVIFVGMFANIGAGAADILK